MQFIQFLFPDRTRQFVDISVRDEIEKLANELKAAGWQFEIECNPRTGMVHGDCCNEDTQLSNFLVENGPAVPDGVVTMVKEAHEHWTDLGKPKADEMIPSDYARD